MWESLNVSKYRNKKTEMDGEKFDSKKECARFRQLRFLEKEGVIKDLQRQVKYELIPKTDKFRACSYIADFVYVLRGETIVEDVKGGVRTQVYLMKKKLMYYKYGIEIKEV